MENIVKNKYKSRLIVKKIEFYLKIFSGLVIEGPKWFGFTIWFIWKKEYIFKIKQFRFKENSYFTS